MSLKPVWIALAASTDLLELAAKQLVGQFPGHDARSFKDGFRLRNEDGLKLVLSDGGPADDYEDEERAQLEAWNCADFVHSVQSKDPHLTLELIVRLSKLTDLAIDDDMGLLLKVQEFLTLRPEQQVSFLTGNGI